MNLQGKQFYGRAIFGAIVLTTILSGGAPAGAWFGGGDTDDLGLPRYGTLDWIAEEALNMLPAEEAAWITASMRDYLLGTEGPERGVIAAYYSRLDDYEDSDDHFMQFKQDYQVVSDPYLAVRAGEELVQAKRYYKQGSHHQAAFHAGAMAAYIARAASFPRLLNELDVARLREYEIEVENTIPAYSWGNMDSLRTSTVFQEYIQPAEDTAPPLESLQEAVEELAGGIARGEDLVYGAGDMSLYLPMGLDNSGGGVDVDDWSDPYKATVGESLNRAVNLIARALRDIFRSPLEGDLAAPEFHAVLFVTSTGKSGEVEVAFEKAEDEHSTLWYNIYRSDVSGSFDYSKPHYAVRRANLSLNRELITGLFDGVTYYFAVRAMDGSGNEETNTKFLPVIVGASSDKARPQFRGLLRARGTGRSGEVLLEWPEAADASPPITYLVYEREGGDRPNTQTPRYSTVETSILLEGLKDGTLYGYLVRAIDNLGNVDTNELTMPIMPGISTDAAPPVFAGVKTVFATGSAGEVELTWDTADDLSEPISYNIFLSNERDRVPDGFPDYVAYESPAVITGLEDGKGVYVTVRARDNFGNEEQNIKDFVVIPSVQAETGGPEFFGLQSVEGSGKNGQLVLGWYPAYDVSPPLTYAIYESESSLEYDFQDPVATTQAYTEILDGRTDGERYYYVVRAFDRFGTGETNLVERSAVPMTSADTVPPVFTGLTTAEATGQSGEVRLGWAAATDPSGPVSYRVYRSLSRGTYDFDNPYLEVTDSSVVIEGLIDNREYFFVVRAVDAVGNEDANLREAGVTPVDNPNLVDSIPPEIVSSVPSSGAVDVEPDTPITILFSEELDPASLQGAITVHSPSGTIPGDIRWNQANLVARFIPHAAGSLRYETVYTVSVLDGVTDTAANHITPREWSFTTGAPDGRLSGMYTFPNPARGEGSVTLHLLLGASEQNARITVRNMQGVLLTAQDETLDTGPNLIDISLRGAGGRRFMPGTYYIQVECRGGGSLAGSSRMVVIR